MSDQISSILKPGRYSNLTWQDITEIASSAPVSKGQDPNNIKEARAKFVEGCRFTPSTCDVQLYQLIMNESPEATGQRIAKKDMEIAESKSKEQNARDQLLAPIKKRIVVFDTNEAIYTFDGRSYYDRAMVVSDPEVAAVFNNIADIIVNNGGLENILGASPESRAFRSLSKIKLADRPEITTNYVIGRDHNNSLRLIITFSSPVSRNRADGSSKDDMERERALTDKIKNSFNKPRAVGHIKKEDILKGKYELLDCEGSFYRVREDGTRQYLGKFKETQKHWFYSKEGEIIGAEDSFGAPTTFFDNDGNEIIGVSCGYRSPEGDETAYEEYLGVDKKETGFYSLDLPAAYIISQGFVDQAALMKIAGDSYSPELEFKLVFDSEGKVIGLRDPGSFGEVVGIDQEGNEETIAEIELDTLWTERIHEDGDRIKSFESFFPGERPRCWY